MILSTGYFEPANVQYNPTFLMLTIPNPATDVFEQIPVAHCP